jgi:hypothetical protein
LQGSHVKLISLSKYCCLGQRPNRAFRDSRLFGHQKPFMRLSMLTINTNSIPNYTTTAKSHV